MKLETLFLKKRKINGSMTIKSSNMQKKRHVGIRKFEVKLFQFLPKCMMRDYLGGTLE